MQTLPSLQLRKSNIPDRVLLLVSNWFLVVQHHISDDFTKSLRVKKYQIHVNISFWAAAQQLLANQPRVSEMDKRSFRSKCLLACITCSINTFISYTMRKKCAKKQTKTFCVTCGALILSVSSYQFGEHTKQTFIVSSRPFEMNRRNRSFWSICFEFQFFWCCRWLQACN